MPTLVLPSDHHASSLALWRAALHAGWEVAELASPLRAAALAGHDLVVYGTPSHGDAVAAACDLALLEPSPGWLPGLPSRYRQREIELSTIGAVRAWPRRAFIKPPGDKVFPAAVYDRGIGAARGLADDDPALVAEPVRFEVEVRAFVAERRIVALSAYVRGGVIACTHGDAWPLAAEDERAARAFLAEMLADPAVEMPPGVVIDSGVIEGRGWAVVEANPAWTSAVCGCDPRSLLDVLRLTTVPRRAIDPAHARWIRGAHSRGSQGDATDRGSLPVTAP